MSPSDLPPLPGGTVTFLFTDIAGSSGLWERGPNEMRASLAFHDELIHRYVAQHGGSVVKHLGDGCWAAFPTAQAAVEAAITFQEAHQQGSADQPLQLSVRIGLHTGPIEPTGRDYFGPVVNRAARIVDLAGGNQIVCSAPTASLLKGIRTQSDGDHELRGIGTEEIHLVLDDRIVTATDPLRRPVAPNNLPTPKTTFVGRGHDLETAAAHVAQNEIVTLIGPGGVGKTRLAIEIARDVGPLFGHHVHFCDLVPLTDGDGLIESVAATVGARRQPGMTLLESTIDYLTDRNTLLIFDNCEHVIDAVREIVDRLACDGVHVLATSREALQLQGEQQVLVAPLDVSGSGIDLFVDRAQRRDPRFMLTDDNREAVGQIVGRLDGIPLAIELAAARIRLMTPAELAKRLGDGHRVLERGGAKRHETLHNTVLWSYELLTEAEAKLFTRLSVFAGGFSLVAAEEICAGDSILGADVPDLLLSLVDKSMVQSNDSNGHQRFRLLEALRSFASDRLFESGESAHYQDQHATVYTQIAVTASAEIFSGSEADVWRLIDDEWANFRHAFESLSREDDFDQRVELTLALVWYSCNAMRYEVFGWAKELLRSASAQTHPRFTDLCGAAALGSYFMVDGQVAEVAERGLDADPSDPSGYCRIALAAVFLNNVHSPEESDGLTSDWLASNPQTTSSRLWAHGFRVFHLATQGQVEEAIGHAHAVAAIATETNSPTAKAIAAWAAGQTASFQSLDAGLKIWSDGIEWSRSLPSAHLLDQLLTGMILHVTVRRGELGPSLQSCRDAISDAITQHYHAGTSHLFGVAAIALSRAGDPTTGARLIGAMMANGHLPRRNARLELEQALGEQLEPLLDAGQTLGITDAAQLALASLDTALESLES